jgi:peptidoglycan/LPS O-acetylase OafA/YrhL
MQAGGVQVDLLFMLSGFLLVYKYLHAKAGNTLVNFIKTRCLRLLPPILAVGLIGVLLGDSWDVDKRIADQGLFPNFKPVWLRFASIFTFVLNYVDVEAFGSFTLSLCWSCCVDMHSGAIITVISNLVRGRISKGKDKGDSLSDSDRERFAVVLRRVFFVWLCVSLATRAYLFDVDTLNIFKLGQLTHFGNLMTDNSYTWIAENWGHKWMTSNTAKDFAHEYMLKMYNPTHTRYGPFTVGGILACSLYLAKSDNKISTKQRTVMSTVACWFWTVQAIVMLVVPCLPSDDNQPWGAQFFATTALRTVASMCGAFLLFRALVPASHPWHWSLLCSVLSLDAWQFIAETSYCSYLVHFRVLMELNFSQRLRNLVVTFTGMGPLPLEGASAWIAFMPRLWIVGSVVSLGLARVLHMFAERPFLRLATNNTTKVNVTSFGDVERLLERQKDK